MGLRTLAITFGAATALSAQFAIALGLGEIKLNSTLNQPLNAEIRLLEVRDLSEQEILVGLASLEDFNRVGVDRPFFLSDLNFAVDLDSRGGAVVSITSKKPVREPFLNFVVEAQWPSGRLLREYTLLMDLPVFSEDQQAAPVQPATQKPAAAGQTGNQQSAQTTQERRSPSAPAESRGQASASGSTYGPVSASDTLWDIAAATRADRSISIQQSMIAIQRANPGAFINDNINLLRRGQVLRIPAADEMRALTSREAIAEVAYQNQRWSGAANTAAAPQLEGSKSYSTSDDTSNTPEGRVKLASPEDFSSSNEGRGTGSSGGSVDALESELAVTLEELDKSKSENEELRSRIAAMEAQIETMERLVDVSSEEMRALQLAAQQTRDAAEASASEEDTAAGMLPEAQSIGEIPDVSTNNPPPTSAGDAEPSADADLAVDHAVDEPVNEGSATQGTVDQETAEDAQAEADVVKTAPDPTRVVRSAPAAKPGILDLLLDNILFIVLGFVALIAAVAVFLRSRNNDAGDDDFDTFVVDQESDDFETVEPYDEAEGNDDLGSLDLGDDDEHFLAEEADEQEEHRAEQETEDAVAEADIYIALAKYEEAEDILLRALEKEPTDTNIRLKLLELYAAQQDLESFDPQYAKLRAIADDDVIERAENLRHKIAGAPEFDESRFDTSDAIVAGGVAGSALAAAGGENPDDDLLLDLDNELNFDDLDVGSTSSSDLDEEINSTLNETEDDLADFDLDLGDDFATDGSASAPAQGDDDDFSFDFELDASGDQVTSDSEIPSDQVGLADELTLDMETDSTPATTDSEALDFDLSAEFDQAPGEQNAVSDEDDLEFNLDELDADNLTGDLTVEESEADELNVDVDEPETLEDAVAFDLGAADADSDDDSLDRELNTEMDLSALDDELDAMTSGLDADLAGLDAELDTDLGSTAVADTVPESESPSADSAPTLMDEPDIDFDELDNLDLESLTAEGEGKSAEDTPETTPTLSDEHAADEPLDLSGGFDLDADSVGSNDSAAPATDTPAAVEQVETETAADEDLPDLDNLMNMNESDFELHDIDPESDDDSDLGFLSDSDETATKLDLARAYMDMGDTDGAKDILEEIIHEGSEEQRSEAQKLLDRV